MKKNLLEQKIERLKTLLYNAIEWIDEEVCNFFDCEEVDHLEWFENAIGITFDELQEVGCDWLLYKEKDEEDE